MDPTYLCTSQPTSQANPEAYQNIHSYSQINHLTAVSEQHADITIMTKEGDKVTLSSGANVEASLTTYNSMAQTDTSYVDSKGMLFSFDASRQISVGVEGDLNDKERKEIKEVIKTIFKMIRGFLSGKAGNIAKTARKFTDFKEISNIDAEFEQNKTIAMLNHSVEKSTTYSPLPEKETLSNSGTGESTPGYHPIDRLTDRMVEVVKDSRIKPDKFLRHFDRMVSWLSRELLQGGPDGLKKLGMIQTIIKEFIEKLQDLSAKPEDTEPKDSSKVPSIDSPEEIGHSGQVSVLQLDILNQSSSFRLEYAAVS